MCGGQRLTSACFLSGFSTLFLLRQEFSLNLEVFIEAGQPAPPLLQNVCGLRDTPLPYPVRCGAGEFELRASCWHNAYPQSHLPSPDRDSVVFFLWLFAFACFGVRGSRSPD